MFRPKAQSSDMSRALGCELSTKTLAIFEYTRHFINPPFKIYPRNYRFYSNIHTESLEWPVDFLFFKSEPTSKILSIFVNIDNITDRVWLMLIDWCRIQRWSELILEFQYRCIRIHVTVCHSTIDNVRKIKVKYIKSIILIV